MNVRIGGAHMASAPTLDDLTRRLSAACPHCPGRSVPPDASLTNQLGIDSLVLMLFLADVRSDYGVDLADWLVHQAARGRDTLCTLAEHLDRARGGDCELSAAG